MRSPTPHGRAQAELAEDKPDRGKARLFSKRAEGRLLLGWSISINGTDIPIWVSIVGFVISAGLAVGLWRESV